MSGIMNMFSSVFGGGQAPAQAPANQPAAGTQSAPPNPGQIPQNAPNSGASNSVTAPNGTLPVTGDQMPGNPASTPFDQYADLWKNDPVDPNSPKPNGVFGELDPKKFMEVAGKIDFSKAITPDQLQKISAGGDEAMNAFASALNAVAQSTYAQAAYASTKITEQALNRARENFTAELPSHIKRHQVSDNLRRDNPMFSNPAVAPLVDAMEARFTMKYPNATPTEITQMAQSYIGSLGSVFSPQKPADGNQPAGKNEPDWEKYFEG